ncbi:myopalladin-like [Lethenteron reissneri]|uniref:myopalladin-like n=1 Tax=Lethenteron reissneri TaxID=7753 RepID=UPI002AB7A519|nr:myopalladin-like [Lethenteron reissneri]
MDPLPLRETPTLSTLFQETLPPPPGYHGDDLVPPPPGYCGNDPAPPPPDYHGDDTNLPPPPSYQGEPLPPPPGYHGDELPPPPPGYQGDNSALPLQDHHGDVAFPPPPEYVVDEGIVVDTHPPGYPDGPLSEGHGVPGVSFQDPLSSFLSGEQLERSVCLARRAITSTSGGATAAASPPIGGFAASPGRAPSFVGELWGDGSDAEGCDSGTGFRSEEPPTPPESWDTRSDTASLSSFVESLVLEKPFSTAGAGTGAATGGLHDGAGEASRRAPGHAPSFTQRLRSCRVSEGSQVVMECHVTGDPTPTVSWTCEDSCVLPPGVVTSVRGAVTSADGAVTSVGHVLEVAAARAALHSARYSCVARNRHGSATTSAVLTLTAGEAVPPAPHRKKKEPPPVPPKPVSRHPITSRILSSTPPPPPPPPPPIGRIKPRVGVRKSMSERDIRQSKDALIQDLEKRLHMRSIPRQPRLSHEEKMARRLFGNKYEDSVTSDTDIASDPGASVPECPLTRQYYRPHFVQPLSDVTGSEGDLCRLDCKVTGLPEPEVAWSVEGHPVSGRTAGCRALVQESGLHSLLLLLQLRPGGAGGTGGRSEPGGLLVTCVARNAAGESGSSARVTITPMEVESPPHFVMPLRHVVAEEGSPFRLEVVATSQQVAACREGHGGEDGEEGPLITFSWLKDKQSVHPSEHTRMHEDGCGYACLVIGQAGSRDAGWYSVSCRSRSGLLASCTARVTVQPRYGPSPTSPEPPPWGCERRSAGGGRYAALGGLGAAVRAAFAPRNAL